jgi:ubiquinone/menaquinone biosynthesis C-methylase UbiE
MLSVARRNAAVYGLVGRVEYEQAGGSTMPFDEGTFDAVFSNGSLHEWSDVPGTLAEMWRVLRSGGRLLVSDLRRDMPAPVKWFMWLVTKPKAIRPGLKTSIDAAYTPPEIEALVGKSRFVHSAVSYDLMGLEIAAVK